MVHATEYHSQIHLASNAFGFTFTMVNAGGYSITWPASVDWVDGSAPILTSIWN
jgi:hypothetical protein